MAEGQAPSIVAHALRCSLASVYHWATQWRREGVRSLAEGTHRGVARRSDAAGEAALAGLLGSDPQTHGHRSTGWTVPQLQSALVAGGDPVRARAVRRAGHPLGYRWKRPQDVLGRPDPDAEAKKGG